MPGKSHGQRSLVGYSPWGRKGSDRTEQLHFTSLLRAGSELPPQPRPTFLLRPKVGELKASSLAKVSSESQFSGIDPWVFHLPGALPGEARERREQNEFGRPFPDIAPGSRVGEVQKRRAWVQGAVWSSWGQLGAWCVSFAGSLEPREMQECGGRGPIYGPTWLEPKLQD